MTAKTDPPPPTDNAAPRRPARPPRAFPAHKPAAPAAPAPPPPATQVGAPPATPAQAGTEGPPRPLATTVPDTAAPLAAQTNVPETNTPAPEPVAPPESVAQNGLHRLVHISRGFRWGAVFFAALSGLITLAAGLWVSAFLQSLFAAQGLLGWLALALFALLCLAAFVMIVREIVTLSRLKHLGRLLDDARSALAHDDDRKALAVCAALKDLLAERKALAWTVAELREHESDIMSARERLALAERALMVPLDTEARKLIAATAQRVSVVTALSPMGVLDVLYVGAENLRLMRQISLIYGGRPGTFGMFRLARMVMTNLIVAGTMALGEDVIQQLLGHRLGAKLSARLGEGLLNGALTARIGLATINTIRPLPYIEAKPARFADFLKELARAWGEKFTGRSRGASS